MHLRDYLHDISLKALKIIADTLDISVEYRARIKLMNAIDRAFWDGALVESLMAEMPQNRRRVLSLIAFAYTTGVTEEQLEHKMDRLYAVSPTETLEHRSALIPQALIAGLGSDQGIYFCPGGIAEQVRRIAFKDKSLFTERPDSPPVFSPPDMLEDIYSFLAHAYKNPLPLTLMGKVRKSALERIFTGSPTCADKELKLSCEKRGDFVISYLVDRGLVSFGRQEAVITSRHEEWLDLAATDRIGDITAFALVHVLKDIETIVAVNGLLTEIPTSARFDREQFIDFIDAATIAPGGKKRLESRLRTLLAFLSRLGLFFFMDGFYYLTVSGEKLFQGERIPMDSALGDTFTVQPNFEAIVGPELHPRLRFKIELLADRTKRDTVLTYSISQKGIARAREQGMTTEQILRFFHEHSRTPVPQNVGFSIEEWSKSYGSIYFEQVTLMRFRDEIICERVMHSPEIAPFILEQLSDTAIIIPSSHIQTVSQHLKKAGFLPEAFESGTGDSDSFEKGFAAESLESIMKDHQLPTIYSNFIFPSELFDEEGDA